MSGQCLFLAFYESPLGWVGSSSGSGGATPPSLDGPGELASEPCELEEYTAPSLAQPSPVPPGSLPACAQPVEPFSFVSATGEVK